MTLQVIVGGQFGSEGKGAIAAYLASSMADLLAVRVAGPNAGHTVIGRCPPDCEWLAGFDRAAAQPGYHRPDGHPWRLRQIPVAAVTNEKAILAIGPGSEVDPDVLLKEVTSLDRAGYGVSARLWLDFSATVITQEHKAAESDSAGIGLVSRIGSTGKGIGAARADRIMRGALTASQVDGWPCTLGDVGENIRYRLLNHGNVQIEGTQGYGLGLHSGFYPHCTSSDCTAMDFMAMAGCPPWLAAPEQTEVWVVYRTYPIRVAGNSGPLAGETTWDEVGQPPELTTVTQRVRRVGHWDAALARRALEANGHRPGRSNVFAALTMADYVLPGLYGTRSLSDLPDEHDVHDRFDHMIARYSKDIGTLVRLVGTGPASVIDLRHSHRRMSEPQPKEYIS